MDHGPVAGSTVPATAPVAVVVWHSFPAVQVERPLETGGHGLTSSDAAARLARFGPNQLEDEPLTPAWVVFVRQFRSPLIFVLLVALAVTILLGEHLDASVIAAVLLLNAVIGATQERKAEGAVRALMQLVVPRARVVRTIAISRSTAGSRSPATWCSWSPGGGSRQISDS